MKSLVIVESPAKARTINKFLGSDYTVKASIGHVRDLPGGRIGIDTSKNFKPEYEVMKGKEKVLKELKAAAKKSETIYLCPDPDREGEAIAWHIAEELGGSKRDNIYRVTFHEITKNAVREAIGSPGKINMDLVEAQQARRILDRLVGYNLSPLLWRKVRRGLSAGRVQSVAVKLVVDREREIEAFEAEEYWTVTALFEGEKPPSFEARLARYRNKKIELPEEGRVRKALDEIGKAEGFTLEKVERKERRRNPYAPFSTSKLQQESARKLGFGAKKTMTIAQQLYEGIEIGEEGAIGLITYMRTDSVRVSSEAQEEARTFIGERYGKDYVPAKPRVFKSKKGAQDAHEAVRPTSVLRDPETMKGHLSRDQFRLYQLIWNRFVSSQMAAAIMDQTVFSIQAGEYLFRATGTVVRFPGFTTIYTPGVDDTKEEKEDTLPALEAGTALKCLSMEPKQHFTQPPPRFTEATIVKELEERGIGRPSTYASIISTVQARKYVEKKEGRFHPTELGVVVNDLLVEHFGKLIDYGFTARMEEELDAVEEGRMEWVRVVTDFFGPFEEDLNRATDIKRVKPEDRPTDITCEKCGKPMVERWGRHGRFIACIGFPDCTHTLPLGEDGETVEPVETDETCEKCGKKLVLRTGRYGKFLACSGYPECRTTKPLPTGVPCPKDGGDIVERRSKSGRTFYSCVNFPACRFTLWSRPVPEPCPDCKTPFLLEKTTRDKKTVRVCHDKACGYSRPVTPEGEDDASEKD